MIFFDRMQLLKKGSFKSDININNDDGMQNKPDIIFKKKGIPNLLAFSYSRSRSALILIR
jgi:hypothetical protein